MSAAFQALYSLHIRVELLRWALPFLDLWILFSSTGKYNILLWYDYGIPV